MPSALSPFVFLKHDFFSRRGSFRWSGLAAGLAAAAGLRAYWWPGPWAIVLAVAAVAMAIYVMFASLLHPRIYLGRGLAAAALLIGAAAHYLSLTDVSRRYVLARTFQLSGQKAVYQDPVEK